MTMQRHEPEEEPQHEAPPPRKIPDGMGVILLLAVIPFTLVWLLLTAIFGDFLAKYGPFVFYFALFGFVLWMVVARHLAEPKGWALIARRFFAKDDRPKQMRNVALLLFGAFVLMTIGDVLLTIWLLVLREWLWQWTIPWPF